MAIKTLQDFTEALQRSMALRGLDVTVTPMTPQKGNKGMQKRLFLTPHPPSATSPPTSSSESPNTQADG